MERDPRPRIPNPCPRIPDPRSAPLRVVCIGDCGVDRYVNLGLDRAGGITLNVAVNAVACFAETAEITVVTALGQDAEAEVVLGALRHTGIACRVARLEGRTPVQYIERQASGERRFLRYDEGVMSHYRPGIAEQRLIAEADLIVTNVFRQVRAFFDAVMAASPAGLRFVDFLDLADWNDGPDFVASCVDRFDIGQCGLRPDDEVTIARLESLAREHGKLLIVTLGPDGSLALGGPERLRCPAERVPKVVDTTGAGDAFAAGFLATYARTRDVADSLRAGSRRAARVVQRLGAF